MPYVLGVDIGNSYTAAAAAHFSEGDHLPTAHPVRLSPQGNAVPSVAFVAEDGRVLVGEAAEQAGISRPDCVVRDFRQRIGDSVPIAIGNLGAAPEDIFATVVRWVVDRAAEAEGAPPDAISVTHPANWGDYRIRQVREALAGVGLANVTTLSEPEAAAVNHAQWQPESVGGTIAVYDLGGSSFTVSLVTVDASGGCELLGQPGHIERLGGADFDELVFRRLAERIGDRFPQHSADVDVLEGVAAARQECTKAKETLSYRTEASILVALPGVRATVRLVRPEFEAMIDGPVHATIEELRQKLEEVGLSADDLAAVLLVGGTASIPLIARDLAEEFDRPTVIDPDPAAAFSLGAAISAAYGVLALREREVAPEQQELATTDVVTARSHGLRRPVAAISGFRLRSGPRVAQISARAVPVAVAAVVAGLILTVVVAQGTGLSTLAPEENAGADGTGWFTPESLRADGIPGFPFGAAESDPGATTVPFFDLPPSAGAADRDPASNRSSSGAPRRGETSQAAPRPSAQQSGNASTQPAPAPNPAPASDPDPEPVPVPDPEPVPVPDPEPDPLPDPVPVPDPVPEPEPDPVPDPDPVPVPDPDPPVDQPVEPGP